MPHSRRHQRNKYVQDRYSTSSDEENRRTGSSSSSSSGDGATSSASYYEEDDNDDDNIGSGRHRRHDDVAKELAKVRIAEPSSTSHSSSSEYESTSDDDDDDTSSSAASSDHHRRQHHHHHRRQQRQHHPEPPRQQYAPSTPRRKRRKQHQHQHDANSASKRMRTKLGLQSMLTRFPGMFQPDVDRTDRGRNDDHEKSMRLVLKRAWVVSIELWKLCPLSPYDAENLANTWWFRHGELSFARVEVSDAQAQSLQAVVLPKGHDTMANALNEIIPIHIPSPFTRSSSSSSNKHNQDASANDPNLIYPPHMYLLHVTPRARNVYFNSSSASSRGDDGDDLFGKHRGTGGGGEARLFLVRWRDNSRGWTDAIEWDDPSLLVSSKKRDELMRWSGAPRNAMMTVTTLNKHYSASSSSSHTPSKKHRSHKHVTINPPPIIRFLQHEYVSHGLDQIDHLSGKPSSLYHPNFDHELNPTKANWSTMTMCGQGSYGTVVAVDWAGLGRVVVKFTNAHEKLDRTEPSNKTRIHPIKRVRYTSVEVARGMQLANNEYVAQYYGWFSYGSNIAIVMQKLHRSLSQLLVSDGRGVTDELMLRIAEGVTKGLRMMHSKDRLVHRDIKPDNIMLDEDGNPFIIDVAFATAMPTVSKVAGSRAFMSPYLAQCKEDGSDVSYDNGNADWYGWSLVLDMMNEYKPLPKSVIDISNAMASHIREFPTVDASHIADDLIHVIEQEMEMEHNRRTSAPVHVAAGTGRGYNQQQQQQYQPLRGGILSFGGLLQQQQQQHPKKRMASHGAVSQQHTAAPSNRHASSHHHHRQYRYQ